MRRKKFFFSPSDLDGPTLSTDMSNFEFSPDIPDPTSASQSSKKQNALSTPSKMYQANMMAREVKKHYSLACAKLLLYIASKIKKEDNEMPFFIFDVRELCIAVGWDPAIRKNRFDMRQMIVSMMSANQHNFSFLDKDNWDIPLPWLQYGIVQRGSSKIAVRLNPILSPYFLQLTTNFMQIDTVMTYSLRGKNSIKLYELAKEIAYRGEDVVSIQYIREMFDLTSDSYSRPSNIVDRVIGPAVKEINEKTDLHIEFDSIIRGRKIDALLFRVSYVEMADTTGAEAAWLEDLKKYSVPEEEAASDIAALKSSLESLANGTFDPTRIVTNDKIKVVAIQPQDVQKYLSPANVVDESNADTDWYIVTPDKKENI